jgi:hypothetical protein
MDYRKVKTMSEYTIQIGTEVRDMTPDEITQRDKDLAECAAEAKARADKAKLKADTLAKLGLTAEEADALFSK